MNRYAVITMTHNGGDFVPVWLNYYRKYFRDEDIYIIDHLSDDGSITKEIRERHNIIQVPFHGLAKGDFINQHVQFLHKKLEQTGKYRYIIYGDIDEIVIADPNYFRDIVDYLDHMTDDHITPGTRSPIHMPDEDEIDLTKPILSQRKIWFSEENFDKPCINKTTPFWVIGFHFQYDPEFNPLEQSHRAWHKSRYNTKLIPKYPDPRVLLIHMKRIDRSIVESKRMENQKHKNTADWQWRHKLLSKEESNKWFYGIEGRPVEWVPERFKNIL
jgi:hypothetical protein